MDSTLENTIDSLIKRADETGILELSSEQKLDRLSDELDAVIRSNKLYDEPWYEPERGITSNAIKFFKEYEQKLREKLCDSEKGCLKPEYLKILEAGGTANLVKTVANVILSAIDPKWAIPSLVVTFAIWLVSIKIELWCKGDVEPSVS